MGKSNAKEPKAIVIGGSAGALDALTNILPALPADFALPIALVLHLLPGKPSQLASVLSLHTRLSVRETDDKQPFTPGTIYVAPPNYHLLLEKTGCLSLSVEDPVLFSRPSIDVLFESAAEAYGPSAVGVLLSGANEDGAAGLRGIAAAGGITIVQHPDTATARAMPEAALQLFKPHHVLPLAGIGALLARLPHATAE
ncbi:MAG TPA: chemotaxis protein CheB, partial [Polyangiaceae bacterium]|nr:chemotaxis protein CheB [Polyangiaceae bacterium]